MQTGPTKVIVKNHGLYEAATHMAGVGSRLEFDIYCWSPGQREGQAYGADFMVPEGGGSPGRSRR